jgi:hypothetical protein
VAEFDLLERHDQFASLRNGIRKLGEVSGEWAGIPMPLEDEQLVVEPKYPRAKELMAFGKKETSDATEQKIKLRNSWWCARRRCEIYVLEVDGKITWGLKPAFHHIAYDLSTLGASVAWGIEQEAKAVSTLGTLVRHHTFKMYMLTGMFLETSERSGITYVFRRLKPTVALKPNVGYMRILCTLCLHPIAYYAGSWAGAMCPTDDVIAHLMLMRADEHMYWKRANQHPPYRPESGL